MKSRPTIATGCLVSIGVAAAGGLAVAEAEAERARRPPPRDRNLVRLPVRRRPPAQCQGENLVNANRIANYSVRESRTGSVSASSKPD